MEAELKSIIDNSKIKRCIQCGRCTGSCPAGRNIRFLTRRLIYEAKMGMDVLSKDELWFCTTCFLCYERCPKGVNITDAIIKIRNIAAREGKHPAVHLGAIDTIHSAGSAFPLSDDVRNFRAVIGLEKESPSVSNPDFNKNEAYFDKFRKLFEDLPIHHHFIKEEK